MKRPGILFLVSLGPGDNSQRTFAAQAALERSKVLIGYKGYLLLLSPRQDQKIVASEIGEEEERARMAVDIAASGSDVSLVSSGDVGIYAMAGLVYEVLKEKGWLPGRDIEVEVLPGVSAFNAAASRLGAPLMHDFACISLSDLMTPWDTIARRLEAAAQADFVICLYNPQSRSRNWQLTSAQQILLALRSGETPVGIVTNGYREGEKIVLTTLKQMTAYPVDMSTTLLIGNSKTFQWDRWMVTPRGYHLEKIG